MSSDSSKPRNETIYVLESKSNHHDWRPGIELAVGFTGKVIGFTSRESARIALKQNSDFSGVGGNILRRSGQKYRIAKWQRKAKPMTEKPNSVCKHKHTERRLTQHWEDYCLDCNTYPSEPVAEPAEPSASPLLATSGGGVQLHQAMSQVVSAEPTAEGPCLFCLGSKTIAVSSESLMACPVCCKCKYGCTREAYCVSCAIHRPYTAAPQSVAGETQTYPRQCRRCSGILEHDLDECSHGDGFCSVAREVPRMTLDEFAKKAGDSQRENFRMKLAALRTEISTIEKIFPELAEGTPKLEDPMNEFIDAVNSLLEWMPKYSVGSSGHLRQQRAMAAVNALILRPFITPACSLPNGKMEVSTEEYGNLLAIWQTAVMLFSGPPNELPDVEAMRQRMHKLATPASTVEAEHQHIWLPSPKGKGYSCGVCSKEKV